MEKGGVSAAARALNVGQPAVTKRLRALEECYGIPLTERAGSRLRLTEAGEKVYLLAVQTLDRQLSLRQDLQDLARGKTTLHLEATLAIGEHLLPDLLLQFSELFPDHTIQSRLGYNRLIQAHLADGMADLALLENAPDHPDLMIQKWMEDELWLTCGSSHPLAETKMIPVESLKKLGYVLRERGSSARLALDEAMQGIGISELNVVLEVGATDTIMEILARGRYVSFLPRFAVKEEVNSGRLCRVKVSGFRIGRTLWIARNRNNVDHPVAEAFTAMLRGG